MNAGTNRYLPLLLGVGWLIVLSHPATVLADIHSNLQVRYRLDEMSGSAADSSGNGNTGTLNNGANFTANGRFGGAVNLEGTDEYIGCPAIAATSGATALTIAFWVYVD